MQIGIAKLIIKFRIAVLPDMQGVTWLEIAPPARNSHVTLRICNRV
jgi:hypothetical protein